jgi:hypothetical protein
MAEPTGNERGHDGGDIAAAARDRGMERLETAKAQLAEGAERVAAAVDRTADELDGGGDEGMSGFGHSAATLMRQLAGGLRERDVEEFARELGALARRNPGVFLAGSVALGFGIARFFKARSPRGEPNGAWRGAEDRRGGEDWRGAEDWREPEGWRSASAPSAGERGDFDAEETLDLSANSLDRRGTADEPPATHGSAGSESIDRTDDERSRGKARQGGKPKARSQRASSQGAEQKASDAGTNTGRAPTDASTPGASADSALTGGTGSGPTRGDKS